MQLPEEVLKAAKKAKFRAKKRAKKRLKSIREMLPFAQLEKQVFPLSPMSGECTPSGRLMLAQYGFNPFSNKEWTGKTRPLTSKRLTKEECYQYSENKNHKK